MSRIVRIDLLGGKNVPCHVCGNQWGMHWAANGGICAHAHCFSCIMEWIDEMNYIIEPRPGSNNQSQDQAIIR